MEKLISGFAATKLDYRKQLKMPKMCFLVVPKYSGKSHESAPYNSQRFGSGNKRLA
jgi:hypothetical protein